MLAVAFLAGLVAVQIPSAATVPGPGNLDISFGLGGRVTTDFAGQGEAARAIALQADGKILVGGRAGVGHERDFALARYNTDGTLDTTFGSGGKVRTDVGDGRERVAALAIQPYGKIVATGTTTLHGADFLVVRYVSGNLDPTFGTGGTVTLEVAGGFDTANAMAIQPDGKIIVAGYAVEDRVGFALVRFNEDGTV